MVILYEFTVIHENLVNYMLHASCFVKNMLLDVYFMGTMSRVVTTRATKPCSFLEIVNLKLCKVRVAMHEKH